MLDDTPDIVIDLSHYTQADIVNLELLGYKADDVVKIGILSFKRKGMTRRQIDMLFRELPVALFDEGHAIINSAGLGNGLNPDAFDDIMAAASEHVYKGKELIAKARAMDLIIEYQRSLQK